HPRQRGDRPGRAGRAHHPRGQAARGRAGPPGGAVLQARHPRRRPEGPRPRPQLRQRPHLRAGAGHRRPSDPPGRSSPPRPRSREDAMTEQTMNEVRVITDGGELVAYTDHLDDEQAAWADFNEAATELLPGQIAQLIVDDMKVGTRSGLTPLYPGGYSSANNESATEGTPDDHRDRPPRRPHHRH